MSARLTAADHRLRAITELGWQATVLEIAALHGWRAHHAPRAGVRKNGTVRRTPHTAPGVPDLILVRGPRLIFAELKRETGRTSGAQDGWLAALDREQAQAEAAMTYYLDLFGDLPDCLADFLAAHDPPTVLRRVEADRRVLERHGRVENFYICDYCRTYVLCPDLLDLAARHDVEVPRD